MRIWKTILLRPRGLKVEERAHEILGTLARLRGDFEKLQENFRVLGKHLVNAQGGYADTEKTVTEIRREAGSDFDLHNGEPQIRRKQLI